MGREADHRIPNLGASTAALAGRVRIRRGADRYTLSGGRIPRQRSRAVAPFADCLGPLIPPSLEPVPDCAARISSGKHGHDGGDSQVCQPVRVSGVVARQVDREPGFDGGSDQATVLISDRIVAEDRLVSEGDHVLAGIGGDEFLEERAVDLRTMSGQVACLDIAPQTTGPERRNLGAELRPGPAGETVGYALPMNAKRAGFSVAAVLVQSAARST